MIDFLGAAFEFFGDGIRRGSSKKPWPVGEELLGPGLLVDIPARLRRTRLR